MSAQKAIDPPKFPDVPVFEFGFYPQEVFIGTRVDLTLAVTFPLTAAKMIADLNAAQKIVLRFEESDDPGGTLTSAIASVTPSSLSDGWKAEKKEVRNVALNKEVTVFELTPLGDKRLKPGQSIRFRFSNVQVNDTAGSATINFKTTIGDKSGPPVQNRSIMKVPPATGIDAWADPVNVGLGQESKLYWKAMNGTYIEIQPSDERKDWVGDDPYYYDSTAVSIPEDKDQFTYTVYLMNASGRVPNGDKSVTIYQKRPSFGPCVVQPDGPIDLDQKITISWSTEFARDVELYQDDDLIGSFGATDNCELVPGEALKKSRSNEGFTTLELKAAGFSRDAKWTQDVQFNKVEIKKFAYSSDGNVEHEVVNATSVVQSTDPQGRPTLDVTGPGGPLRAQLPSNPPAPSG